MGELVSELQIPSGDAPVTRADLQRLSDHLLSELLTLRRELLGGQGRQQWINAAREAPRAVDVVPAGFPLRTKDPCAFSINDDGDNPAEVFIRNITVKVGDTEVMLAGPYSIVVDDSLCIYFEYDAEAATGELLLGGYASIPDSDDTHIRKALYTVTFEAATGDHPDRVTGYEIDWCHQSLDFPSVEIPNV
jgi:hypothetical protein